MKHTKSLLVLLAFALLLSSCSSAPDSSGREGSPSSAAATQPPPALTAEAAPTTTEAPSEPARTNEKGPFDDAHYQIGLRALQAIDAYLDGTAQISSTCAELSKCYDDIRALPEIPASDPLAAGNDFVRAYVFLANVDFSAQSSDFSSKKYDDRNYLAAAIGESVKEFSASDDETQLRSFLDGLVAALNDSDGDTLYYYTVDEDGVFFTISMPALDPIYEALDTLPSSDLSAARKIALDFVSGDFAEDLVSHIRSNGGASKAVYITLGCSHGICMASRDLSVFMDELRR